MPPGGVHQLVTAVGLVLLGLAAMALAVVEADHDALAAVFGFTGIATAVLGLLLPRLDDEFELSATGLKGKLRQVHDVVTDEALTLEEKGDAVSDLLLDASESRWSERSSDRAGGKISFTAIRAPVVPPFEWPAPPPPGKVSLRHVGREFEAHVREAFEADGWRVRAEPWEFGDFAAEKATVTLLVEIKAARHLSTADVAQLIAQHGQRPAGTPDWWILAVPQGSLSSAAARVVEENPCVEVLYVAVSEAPGSPAV